MRWRSFILMLFAVVGLSLTETANLYAANQSPQHQTTLQKARILQSLNLLRSLHKQTPLALMDRGVIANTASRVASANGTGAIAGTVSGIQEDAIATAFVVAWTADSVISGGSTGFARVELDGSYIIDGLVPGDYYVLAAADGYLPKFYNNVLNFSEATTVPVTEGAVTKGIDFVMEKEQPGTGSLSGKVVRESDKAPIVRARVNVFSPDNPFLYGGAETAEDGSYLITGLRSGKYYAVVWADGYLSEFFDNATSVENAKLIEVIEPNETTGINFQLTTGGIISGSVVNDDGVAIAGAYVEAMPAKLDSTVTGGWGRAITDEHGEYRIGGLTTGSYFVLAQAWGQWSYAMEWYDNAASLEEATPVAVQVDEETAGINFQLSLPVAYGAIAGTVTDLQGQPIADAFVQAQAPFNEPSGRIEVWAYAVTDKEGKYRIDNLPNGSYLVSASAQSGWQFVQRWWPDAESPDQAQPVILADNVRLRPIDFQLPLTMGAASIAGTVRSSDGRALAGAYIGISPAAQNGSDPDGSVKNIGIWAYGYSDSSGHYQIDRLPAGAYFVHAQYWENFSFGQQWYKNADSLAAATPVILADGEVRGDIDFSLTIKPLYGSIAGNVVDEASGAPISRAYVEVSPVGRDYYAGAPIAFWSYYAVTDEKGNYRLEWLPEGEYLVSVYANGAFEYFENAVVPEQAKPVKVIGGTTTAVNFALTPRNEGPGIIAGRVTAEWTDQLLEIAVVVARPAVTILIWPQSEMFFNAVINADGTYQISGLPPGEYYVMSFAPGYIGEYYDNVYDPAQATRVKVDGINATTGIDFSLSPMLILAEDSAGATPRGGATIFGKVTDNNGNALNGATIYLLNGAGQPLSFVRSHADGTFELLGVPPGSYRLQAGEVGYVSQYNGNAKSFEEAVPIDISNGKVEVNFALAPQTITGVKDQQTSIPKSMEIYGNYPNPFNPETRIAFGLPATMHVKLRIFNVLGEEVAQLYEGVMNAGVHHLRWNGGDHAGQQVTSGLYLYRLESGTTSLTGKMLLMR